MWKGFAILVVGFLEQICSYFKIVNVEFLLTRELDILLLGLYIRSTSISFEILRLSGPIVSTLDAAVPRF